MVRILTNGYRTIATFIIAILFAILHVYLI
jgi:hypothetical protein